MARGAGIPARRDDRVPEFPLAEADGVRAQRCGGGKAAEGAGGGDSGASLSITWTGGVCYIKVFRNQFDGCAGRAVRAYGGRDPGNPDRTYICTNMNRG